MSQLDLEVIRHALSTAQTNGFRVIRMRSGDELFSGVISDIPCGEEEIDVDEEDQLGGPITIDVESPAVGYFRISEDSLAEGQEIEEGVVIAEIVALGIANPVISEVAGVVVELCVADGEALEYGQTIMRIETK